MSNDVPQETNKNICKQNAGSAAKNTAAAISSSQNVMCAAKKTDISMLEHIAQKTEAESHDSNAPKQNVMCAAKNTCRRWIGKDKFINRRVFHGAPLQHQTLQMLT